MILLGDKCLLYLVNSKELQGNPRKSKELQGTPRNSKELQQNRWLEMVVNHLEYFSEVGYAKNRTKNRMISLVNQYLLYLVNEIQLWNSKELQQNQWLEMVLNHREYFSEVR